MLHEIKDAIIPGALLSLLGVGILVCAMLPGHNAQWLFLGVGSFLLLSGCSTLGSVKQRPIPGYRYAAALLPVSLALLIIAIMLRSIDTTMAQAWALVFFITGTVYMAVGSFALGTHHIPAPAPSSPANPQDV